MTEFKEGDKVIVIAEHFNNYGKPGVIIGSHQKDRNTRCYYYVRYTDDGPTNHFPYLASELGYDPRYDYQYACLILGEDYFA